MDIEQAFARTSDDIRGLLQGKVRRGSEAVEIVLPLSTLSHKFVSVFVEPCRAGLLVSDGGYLADGTYETEGGDDACEKAKELLSRYPGVEFGENQEYERYEFSKVVKELRLLSAVVLDMGQLIQLAANLALLSSPSAAELA